MAAESQSDTPSRADAFESSRLSTTISNICSQSISAFSQRVVGWGHEGWDGKFSVVTFLQKELHLLFRENRIK